MIGSQDGIITLPTSTNLICDFGSIGVAGIEKNYTEIFTGNTVVVANLIFICCICSTWLITKNNYFDTLS